MPPLGLRPGAILLLAGCNPAPLNPQPVDMTTGELIAVTTSSSTTDAPTRRPAAGTTRSGTTDASSGGMDDASFLPDVPSLIDCSIFEQDCPAGEKCSPRVEGDGWEWNASSCVPIAPDPGQIDDPCTAEVSRYAGMDDCDRGLVCWFVDPETLTGYCLPMCSGSPESPNCEDPNRECITTGSGNGIFCWELCDPLAPECLTGLGCYLGSHGFRCNTDTSGNAGALGDPCAWSSACDPGLQCLPGEHYPGCVSPGCCSPVCDLRAPTSCRDPVPACLPMFEPGDAPPGLENLGICVGP